MAFTLGSLFEAALLVINAIAILNEKYFLKKGAPHFLLSFFLILCISQLDGVLIIGMKVLVIKLASNLN